MNAQMEKAEASMVMSAMALLAIRRIAIEFWHCINACTCERGWVLTGDPCEIGLEEIAIYKAAEQFAEWDALGLGYIGPILRQEVVCED